uniref:Uncharacterized protein n=1 Tax=Fagus sylvatica TaxID=28930 RepID=A0A2N9I2T1_FAGSY
MRHIAESSRRPLSNDIKFARIGVRTRELWLPEVGVSELFSCTFPCEDSDQTGDAFGEPRVPRRSRSHYLSNAPGLADQLFARIFDLAPDVDFDVLGTVGKLALPIFARFRIRGNPSLDFVRYGPASRVHRGVFGPFEGSFPIRIPADPDKFLAIREFHVVHGCVLFPSARARRSTCCESGRLCAQAWQRRWEIPEFQHNLILSACFHARGRRSSRCRISTILVSSESLVTYFLTVQALHRGEFGFARYDPANGGRRNVPYAKGSSFD